MNTRSKRYWKKFELQQYEELLSSGIAALKSGDRDQSRNFLHRATEILPTDTRAWLWLSATTDDLNEQREYLEIALASDPNNSAAKRGLVLLSEKLDKERLLEEAHSGVSEELTETVDVDNTTTYLCPQCGGRMIYDNAELGLSCEYCGYIQVDEVTAAVDRGGQALDIDLPTSRAHRWAEAQHKLVCDQCGAMTLLAEGERVKRCPYCGSQHLISSTETEELLDPQSIALMQIDQQEAVRRVKQWLFSGSFIPDDLRRNVRSSTIRAAYYPFWIFDGTLEMQWTCEVNSGTSRTAQWDTQSGVEYENFKDVLIPGLKAIDRKKLAAVEPYDLGTLVDFKPEHLAGWHTLAYDISMADASLLAREQVAQKMQRSLGGRVLAGQARRNLRSGALNWSGITYRQILLPLWISAYGYRGKVYRVFVNGQTGKVSGDRPQDKFKVFGIAAIGIIAAVIIIFILIVFLMRANNL
jgi:DNA-directed RNA polymerase subunit RPC12/RpoP